MVDTDNDQKTEEASSKRLQDAREEGQLAISRELAAWFMFVAVIGFAVWVAPLLAGSMNGGLRIFLERPHELSLEDGGLQNVLLGAAAASAVPALLAFGLFFAAATLGTLIQTGFFISPVRLKMDYSRLSPMNGFKNIFSMNAVVELIKSFVKMVVLGYLAYRIMKPLTGDLPMLTEMSLPLGLSFLHDETVHIIAVLMVVITMIAVVDTVYVRFTYYKGLRMTKQEVKDEHKQMEGDPYIKGRLRQIRLEKARRRMMASVPKADVVITNPTHFAVALQYDNKKMAAPVVLAKGADKIAARIREVAEKHEIPLVSNPPLARALYDTVDIDEPITPEHYRAVAEVISYVYKIKGKAKGQKISTT